MVRIPPLAQAIQRLRTEQRLAQAQKNPSTPPASALAQPPALRRTALSQLPARLRALRAGAPHLPAPQALRLFVEATLIDEFGEQLQLDPAFAELVESTSRTIEGDTSSAQLLGEALTELAAMAV